jgi:endonuclease YncB( thermonuclease family)
MMKRITKKLSRVFAGAGLILGLVSCTTNNTSVTDKPATESSSKAPAISSTSGYEHIDYVASLKLERSYQGKKFFEDGIEEATVQTITDGDTSTFKLKNSGRTITVRYLGIDTPESTAGYDKWGKAASVWNKSILSKVTNIVIESNDRNANPDTNGTRYLAFVWYKTSPDGEWRNLNLETLQEGYTAYTGTASTIRGNYHEVFNNANLQAIREQKHLYGNEEDIYYPSKVVPVTLKELKDNYSNYYDVKTEIPTRVGFEAYMIDRRVNNNFITATVAQNINGEITTFDITVGYSGNTVSSMFSQDDYLNGTLYYISGFTNKGYDLHGLEAANIIKKDETTCYRKTKEYVKNVTNLSIQNAEQVGSDVKLTCDSYTITVKNSNVSNYSIGQKISATIYLNEDKTTYFTYVQQIK